MKKMGFVLMMMLLSGCVPDPAVTGGLTPVSAMPKGTATYDGRVSSTGTFNDWEEGGFVTTAYQETTSADFTLRANFDTKTTSAIGSNATIENDYFEEEIGVSGPIRYQNTGTYSGTATGIGIIDTDADGIYFNNPLNGNLTMTSATSNGVPVTPSDYFLTSKTIDQVVSGYFTGGTASGIYGRETGSTGATGPEELSFYTDTVTGTRR